MTVYPELTRGDGVIRQRTSLRWRITWNIVVPVFAAITSTFLLITVFGLG